MTSDQAPANSAIAVVGLSCRLPGANNPEQFWQLLSEGADAVTPVPDRRWGGSERPGLRHGGFIEGIDEFDAGFFQFSPREADATDPQQRILLQLAWHALEDAGIPPLALGRHGSAGVYVGAMADDYARLALGGRLSSHSLTGVQRGVLANRISHFLDLTGPSLVVDTGQSSGLTALHLACEALRSGSVSVALAGAVNLNLLASTAEATSRFGALSILGRCAVLDAEADGYVRGEGAVVAVLMPLAAAEAAGLRPYCLLLGSAMTSDGRTPGLTTPDGPSQTRVIRQAWAAAGIRSDQVGYVELHGTGTRLGDPIEARALADAARRDPARPLLVGSAKTNVGHCEGAAGLVGLLKTALSLWHGQLPPSLHFTQPPDDLALDELGITVNTALRDWPAEPLAGVSSFGMGGTNCHVVAAPPGFVTGSSPSRPPRQPAADSRQAVAFGQQWWLAGSDRAALGRQASRLTTHLAEHPADSDEVAATLANGRSALRHRAAVVGTGLADLQDGLRALSTGTVHSALVIDRARDGGLALMLPGQGSQRAGVGSLLADGRPALGHALDEVLAAWPSDPSRLRRLLTDSDADDIDLTRNAQPVLFAVQVASYRLLESWGVTPNILIGHSIGEVAAAHIAGVLTLGDACRLVAARAELMQTMRSDGVMIAVEASAEEVGPRLLQARRTQAIADLAAVNGPRSIVLSGDATAVRKIAQDYAADGRRTRELPVSHAFHSGHMEGMLAEYAQALAGMRFHPPMLPVLPTGPDTDPQAWTDPDYWILQVRSTVQFANAIERAEAAGVQVYLEAAPGRALTSLVPSIRPEAAAIALLPTDTDATRSIALAGARLHCAGIEVRWPSHSTTGTPTKLPGYAFLRRRHWLDATAESSTETVAPEGAVANTTADKAEADGLSDAEIAHLVTTVLVSTLGYRGPSELDLELPFADLGLDSGLTVELLDQLNQRLPSPLTVGALYSAATPQGLIARLRDNILEAVVARKVTLGDHEPIAIVGMGCDFPGGVHDADQLWQLVAQGRDVVGGFPTDRGWDLDGLEQADFTRVGGFLADVADFDADFFAISPREALAMDPQQRLLLTTAWQALEQAGLTGQALPRERTGVFVGVTAGDYGPRLADADRTAGYTLTGSTPSVASGRIAYALDLRGPTLTVDTACSSSLAAIHLAIQALRRGECDVALAGGAAVLSTPGMFVEFSHQRGLSTAGRCAAFGAGADGTVWAEGAGMLTLQPLSDARAAGRPVLAVLLGSAINSDGASNGLTAPSGRAQRAVIEAALTDAGLTAADVDLVEAHGTGTALGDPIEADAVLDTYGRRPDAAAPAYLGSLKSNLGHAQAAAGVGGVIKVVQALRHGRLPATLHAEVPSEKVDWNRGRVELLTVERAWPAKAQPRAAAVSSFGISGTNAHVVLAEGDPLTVPRPASAVPADPSPSIWLVSARSQDGIAGQAGALVEWLTGAGTDAPDAAVAAALTHDRAGFGHRSVVRGHDRDELTRGLLELADGSAAGSSYGRLLAAGGRRLFLFSGQGAQRPGMGRALATTFPAFGEALAEVFAEFDRVLPYSLVEVMFQDGSDAGDRLARTEYAQPALFAYGVAGARLLAAHGLHPDLVLGHSVGELTAAHVAGVLDLPSACALVAARARIMQAAPPGGAMVAFDADPDDLAEWIGEGGLDVAAVNGPQATVLSGDAERLAELSEGWRRRGRRATALRVSHAFHSSHLQAAAQEFEAYCRDVTFCKPAIPLISNETGAVADLVRLQQPEYWGGLIRNPVRFGAGLDTALSLGARAVYEAGPDRVLAGLAGAALERAGLDGMAVSLGRRDRDESDAAAALLAEAACRDRDLRFPAAGPLPVLPGYRFAPRRFWLAPGRPGSSDMAGLIESSHPLLRTELQPAADGDHYFGARLSVAEQPWLADHVIAGNAIVSATTLLELAGQAAYQLGRTVAELVLQRPLLLPAGAHLEVQLRVTPAGDLTVHARSRHQQWDACASGRLEPGPAGDDDPPNDDPPNDDPAIDDPAGASVTTAIDRLYGGLAQSGYQYGPTFRCVQSLRRDADEAAAELVLPAELPAAGWRVHPALLDSALHPLLSEVGDNDIRLPFAWSRVVVHRPGTDRLSVRLHRLRGDTWRLVGREPGGVLAVTAEVNFRPIRRDAVGNDDTLHQVVWTPLSAPARGGGAGHEAMLTADALTGLDGQPLPDPPPATVFVRLAEATETGSDVPARVAEQADRARQLVQAWLAMPGSDGRRLVLVTRDAVWTGAADRVGGLASSAVWGLVRTAQTEYPGRFGLIDLPADDISPELLSTAVATGAGQLAIRGGRLLQPRLARFEAPVRTRSAWDSGTVLITGGNGALGQLIARDLVARHRVGRIVLASRSGSGAEELTSELVAAGADVEQVRCDLADREQVRALLEGIDDLAAIVHAAGTLADQTVAQLQRSSLLEVFPAKVDAAWHLHELVAERPVPLYLFSSISGTVGSAGQGNYAAANSFLDAFAGFRSSAGRPTTALAWGLWDLGADPQPGTRSGSGSGLPTGMGSGLSAADRSRWQRRGFAPITAAAGLSLFATALQADVPALAPVTVTATGLDIINAAVRSTGSGGGTALGHRPSTASGRPAGRDRGDLTQQLTALVTTAVAEVLGRDAGTKLPLRTNFTELGIDSLTGLELRNRLAAAIGGTLPASLVFDYPTPAELIRRLRTELGRDEDEPAADGRASNATNRRSLDEPIAVIGMACRYPGGIADPEDLWRLVRDGRDAIGDFPTNRGWDLATLFNPDPDHPATSYCDQGGFLYDADEFDADFFGIGPTEAAALDPQQRVLLEVGWSALRDAGLRLDRLRGSATGVYAGVMYNDYATRFATPPAAAEGYLLTGNTGSVLSGRLAYTFGLQGPAMTIDTACSSSLVAVHLAVRALRSGECELALAGGVTVMSTPATFREFSRQRGLAPDGRCKSFGAGADGTGWSEGAGMLVLKPLSAAVRNGDRILALVRGSAVNSDGASNGLTAPNGPSQERVIQQALADGGLGPADIDAVEAHGTGTALGDPIEARSLLQTYGANRPAGQPLWLGSLKSNIGHSQAAAGVGGLIKSIQAMRHAILPPTLHADPPSPHVEWDDDQIRLLTDARPWPDRGRPRRISVSSFGIGGTNAHVVLEQAPSADEPDSRPAGPLPLLFNGHSPAALATSIQRVSEQLRGDAAPALPALARTLARATPLRHRTGLVATDPAGLAEQLTDLADRLTSIGSRTRSGATLAMVCSGQGSQRPGASGGLYRRFPVFAEAFDEVAEAFLATEPRWRPGRALTELAFDTEASELDRTENTQVVLFAIQVAQARLLESFGVTPDVLIGHSIGELTACYLAGLWKLPDACTLVAARAKLMGAADTTGAMLAVGAGVGQVATLLSDEIELAAINAPAQVVLSGRSEAIGRAEARLRADGVRTRPLRVSHAFHSSHMSGAAKALGEVAASLRPRPLRCPVISTLTGAAAEQEFADAGYWAEQLRRPVRFADAVAAAAVEVMLELGPAAAVTPLIVEGRPEVEAISLLRKEIEDDSALADALAQLHECGVDLDATPMLARTGLVTLPSYPFERRRFWLEPDAAAPSSRPVLEVELPQLDDRSVVRAGWLSLAHQPWLGEHRVAGHTIVPAAVILGWVLSTAQAAGCSYLDELLLQTPLAVPADLAAEVQVAVTWSPDGAGQAAVLVRSRVNGRPWQLVATGTGSADVPVADVPAADVPAADVPAAEPVTDPYDELESYGYEYGSTFRTARSFTATGTGWLVSFAQSAPAEESGAEGFATLLDGALHPLALAAGRAGRLEVPFVWRGIDTTDTGPVSIGSASLVRLDESRWTLELRDAADQLIWRAAEIGLRAVIPSDFGPAPEPRTVSADLHTVRWRPATASAAGAAASLDFARPDWSAIPIGATAFCAVPPTGSDDPTAVTQLVERSLKLVQAWLERSGPGRLVLLTRDGVAPAAGSPIDLGHSAVVGLLRSATSEHPDRLAVIDSDGSLALPALAGALDAGWTEFAVRDGRQLQPRLEPTAPPRATGGRALSGTVLITGGTGALGTTIALHLADHHPGIRLLLLSRRGPTAPGASQLAENLAGFGARAQIVACDVGDAEALQAILAELATPVTAVLHAAGVLADATVNNLTPEQLRLVLDAKIKPGWQLHRAFTDSDPAFVLFGSVSGLIGTAGQANYAAANSYLDGLAQRRHLEGRQATVLDWGLWDGEGMGAELDAAAARRLRQSGIAGLPAPAGLAILDAVLETSAAPRQLVPVRLDRARVRQRQTGPEATTWLDGVQERIRREARPPAAAAAGFEQRFAAAGPPERELVVQELVQTCAAQTLGFEAGTRLPVDRGFLEAGLDSLAVLKLRRFISERTGLALPPTIAFDFPTPAKLARFLVARLTTEYQLDQAGDDRPPDLSGPQPSASSQPGAAARVTGDFDTATDDELFRFLDGATGRDSEEESTR